MVKVRQVPGSFGLLALRIWLWQHEGTKQDKTTFIELKSFICILWLSLSQSVPDASSSSKESVSDVLQCIFVPFSASVQCLQILKGNILRLTVKTLSGTCWERCADSVKPIWYQAKDVMLLWWRKLSCLKHLAGLCHEAQCPADQMTDSKFFLISIAV